MPNDKNATPLSELQALKAENAKLKARNADLYRDCVAFAKVIKASAKKEEQIDELQKEIITLRSQLETLKQTQYSNFSSGYSNNSSYSKDTSYSNETYTPNVVNTEPAPETEPEDQYEDISSSTPIVDNDTVTYNPRVHYIDQETFEQQNMELEELTSGKPKKEKKAKTKAAHGQYAIARIGVSVLLAFSLLVSVISGISYLFSTSYKDYTVMNYRFASVLNNAMIPDIDMSDVVLIKYCDFEGLKIDSLVVTSKNTRSLAKITDLAVSDGLAVATVEDKTGSYEIYEDEFIGKVEMTIPLLGNVVRYASANAYNYMAIIVSLDLFLVACLLLIPSDKPKQKKSVKDINVADFTI